MKLNQFELFKEQLNKEKQEKQEQIKFKWGTIFFISLGLAFLIGSFKLFLSNVELALDLYHIYNLITPLFIVMILCTIFIYKGSIVFLNQGAEFFKKVKKW
jgi:hypothetical protein